MAVNRQGTTCPCPLGDQSPCVLPDKVERVAGTGKLWVFGRKTKDG
jgi:hypothetical protein